MNDSSGIGPTRGPEEQASEALSIDAGGRNVAVDAAPRELAQSLTGQAVDALRIPAIKA